MGEARRRRASGQIVVMESQGFRFHGGLITKIAGFGIPLESQRHVTDLFYERIAFARSLGEALGPEHETRRRAAFHEAGHAVAAAFGFVPTKAYVTQNNHGAWIGRALFDEKRAPPCETSPCTSPENDWRLAANVIAGFIAETMMVGPRASSSIDEQIIFSVVTGALTAKLELKLEINTAFVDGTTEVMAILRERRQVLDAVGEALTVEPELGRDRLDPLLAGVFDPGRDRAAEFIARLRAGRSQAVQGFATLAAFQRQGERMQPTN